MRRREKFIIVTLLLALALLAVQMFPLEWRYAAIAGLVLLTYLFSSWALADDLQFYERLTIIPLPTMFAVAVGLFYFLLPTGNLSRLTILLLFGVGLYALYLTANIYSVAKGRTIQLLYAAHAVGLFFTLLTSLLLTNTVFSLKLPFYWNGLLLAVIHWPLIFMSLWSVNLEDYIDRDLIDYSIMGAVFLAEFGMLMSFLPVPVWNSSLFITGLMYLILGLLNSFLEGRLFRNTINEYIWVGVFLGLLFMIFFPLK